MITFKKIVITSNFARRFSNTQTYIDNEVVKRIESYTPIAQERFKNRGKMSKAHKIQSPGLIVNKEPKARREYYTNKGFSGKNRGKLWLERMKADHKEEIMKKAKEKF